MPEFPDFLDQHTTAASDLFITGDSNLQYDQPNNTDVSRLPALLRDNRLRQVMEEPTHRHGHTLDWLVVREDRTRQQAGVLDLALVEHKAVFYELSFGNPTRRKRSVTSRNQKRINLQGFRSDVNSFLAATVNEHHHSSAVEDYNSGLSKILDQHGPLITRHITLTAPPLHGRRQS